MFSTHSSKNLVGLLYLSPSSYVDIWNDCMQAVWPVSSSMLLFFGRLQQWIIAQQQKKFTKVGLNFARY